MQKFGNLRIPLLFWLKRLAWDDNKPAQPILQKDYKNKDVGDGDVAVYYWEGRQGDLGFGVVIPINVTLSMFYIFE